MTGVKWINGKEYFWATFGEMEMWIALGKIPVTVLDIGAFVDVGMLREQLSTAKEMEK